MIYKLRLCDCNLHLLVRRHNRRGWIEAKAEAEAKAKADVEAKAEAKAEARRSRYH